MKSNHWFKLRCSCVLISFQRVMKQKCSGSSHIWVAWEPKCFGYVKIQMGPGSQYGATEFSPGSHGILHVSPRPGTEFPGLSQVPLFPCWLFFLFLTFSLTLNFFLLGGLQMISSSHSSHVEVHVGTWMEMRKSKRHLFSLFTSWNKIIKKKFK